MLFRDIAIFRRGPEDLPVSGVLLLLTIAGQVALGFVIGAVLPPLPVQEGVQDHSVAMLLIDLVVTLLWGWALLQIAGRPQRYLQTMTAVFGCQLVLQPLLVPAAWTVAFLGKESSWTLLAAVVVTAISVWALVALARVLRSATDWSMVSCLLLVLSQGLVTYLIAFAAFPDILKQAQ